MREKIVFEILKILMGLFVIFAVTYGAYMLPEWTGILQILDPSGQLYVIFKWFLGLIELFLIVFVLIASYKIGDFIIDNMD